MTDEQEAPGAPQGEFRPSRATHADYGNSSTREDERIRSGPAESRLTWRAGQRPRSGVSGTKAGAVVASCAFLSRQRRVIARSANSADVRDLGILPEYSWPDLNHYLGSTPRGVASPSAQYPQRRLRSSRDMLPDTSHFLTTSTPWRQRPGRPSAHDYGTGYRQWPGRARLDGWTHEQ